MDAVIQFEGTIYEQGYGLIAQRVMRDKDLHPVAKSIYAYLCSFAGVGKDGERTAFPGVSLMMHELGIKTDDTYYKYRKQLVQKGYIVIEKRRQAGAKFDNNIYKIVAVPVELPLENTEKPHPKISGTGEPYPKLSSTEKPSTVKSGTIINSSSINSFYKDEEEYIYKLRLNNIFIDFLFEFLKEKGITEDTATKTIKLFHQQGLENITAEDVEAQYQHMMEMKESGIRIYDFPNYFVTGLERITEQTFANNIYQEQKKQLEDERVKVPLYNWLEDRSV